VTARPRIYAHVSATMPHGITLERSRACLNALAVVCHSWRKPARGTPSPRTSAPGRWLSPLLKWTRPVWRAA